MQPKDVSIFIGTVSCCNIGNLKQITWVPGTYLVIWIAQLFWPQWKRLCRLEGTSGGQTRLLRYIWYSSTTVLKPPRMKRDCIASLGSFFQCLTPVMMKKFLLIYNLNLSLFQLMPVAFHPRPTVKSLPPSSGWAPLRHWRMLFRRPKTTSSPGWTTPYPSACPHRTSAPSTNHCGGPRLNSLQLVNRYLEPLKCFWWSTPSWQIWNGTYKKSASFYSSS